MCIFKSMTSFLVSNGNVLDVSNHGPVLANFRLTFLAQLPTMIYAQIFKCSVAMKFILKSYQFWTKTNMEPLKMSHCETLGEHHKISKPFNYQGL